MTETAPPLSAKLIDASLYDIVSKRRDLGEFDGDLALVMNRRSASALDMVIGMRRTVNLVIERITLFCGNFNLVTSTRVPDNTILVVREKHLPDPTYPEHEIRERDVLGRITFAEPV